jgi:hypothetical protein
MRRLALVALLFGGGAVVYAGLQYSSADPGVEGETAFPGRLPVLLAFAACMGVGGVLLWVVGQMGHNETRRSAVRSRARQPESGHRRESRLIP